jgi:hypothetical protein
VLPARRNLDAEPARAAVHFVCVVLRVRLQGVNPAPVTLKPYQQPPHWGGQNRAVPLFESFRACTTVLRSVQLHMWRARPCLYQGMC